MREAQGQVPVLAQRAASEGPRWTRDSLDGRSQGLNPVAPLDMFSSHEGASGRKKRIL